MRRPPASSTRTTSDRSFSRRDRNSRGGQSTVHRASPISCTSPAAVSATAMPSRVASLRNSSTAALDLAARNDGCTRIRRSRVPRIASMPALKWSRFGWLTNIASTTPPLSAIHGTSSRAPTLPDELEPASKSASAFPHSTACIEPSPTASMVMVLQPASRKSRTPPTSHCGIAMLAAAHGHAARRNHSERPRIATHTKRSASTAAATAARPGCISRTPAAIASSTSQVCVHAGTHAIGPSHAPASAHTVPIAAFG